MEPSIGEGDAFIVVPTFVANPGVSDIAVFQWHEGQPVIVHRIIGETADGFITRGDNSVFSDQQAGRPPVTRDMVVGTVLEFNGSPLVLPYFGTVLGSISSITRNVFFLAALLLVAAGILLFNHTKRFKVSSTRAFRMRHAMAISAIVVVLWGTMLMTAASGTQRTEYIVNKWVVDDHVFDPGESFDDEIDLDHRGIVPAYVILTVEGERAKLDERSHLLWMGDHVQSMLHVTCPQETGYYAESVSIDAYLPLLPPAFIDELHGIDPLLPVLAIDAMLVLPLALYFAICCDGSEQVAGVLPARRHKMKRRWRT
jgi:signal peptidase